MTHAERQATAAEQRERWDRIRVKLIARGADPAQVAELDGLVRDLVEAVAAPKRLDA